MKAFQKHTLMFTSDCLFLLSSTLIHIIHVMSCSYDNLLNLKSLIAFWDGIPLCSLFFACMVTAIKGIDFFFIHCQVVFCIISTNILLFKHCHESSGAFMATEWNGRGGWGIVAPYFSLEMFKMFDKHCPRLEWGYFGLFLLKLLKSKTLGINSKPSI